MNLSKKLAIALCIALGLYFNLNAQELERKNKGKVELSGSVYLASEAQNTDDIRKGWNGKMPTEDNCPDWLDCNTGRLKFFDIAANHIIDNPEWCQLMGVKTMPIRKGIYEVDWKSQKNAGSVVFMLDKPKDPPATKGGTVKGSRPISLSCKFYGHRCASAVTAPNETDQLTLLLSPVLENGQWVGIKLTYNNGNPSVPLII
jgi:hypothetical protein